MGRLIWKKSKECMYFLTDYSKQLILKASWFCLKQLYILAESPVKAGGKLLSQENAYLGGENSPCLGKWSHGRPTVLALA